MIEYTFFILFLKINEKNVNKYDFKHILLFSSLAKNRVIYIVHFNMCM